MRPDEPRRRRRPILRPADQPVPFDAASDPDADDLAELERQLAAAGARVRTERLASRRDRLDPSFAAALRAQLMAGYAGATDSGDRAGSPAAAGAIERSRPPRAVPGPGWRRPTEFVAGRRWAVLAVAAALVVAVLGSVSGRFLPASFDARATEAAGATLVRDGLATTLGGGTVLLANDEIRVGANGRATLVLGASLTRLDAGTDVRLIDLATSGTRIELLAGRSYQRVALPDGGTFVVVTGPVAWEALGTAFDLDRGPTADGRERVRLLGLEHAIGLVGPDLRTTVGEGRAATLVVDGGAASDLAVGPIDPAQLADPWLVDNARRDRALGFQLGVLDGIDLGPTPAPADAVQSAGPAVGPAGPTAAPAATPGSGPTATPDSTPRTVTSPERTPDAPSTPPPARLPGLRLAVTPCDGGVVIDWSRYKGSTFSRYATLRNTTASIPTSYPPHGGPRTLDGASTTVRWKTNAFDTRVEPGRTYSYRTLALNAAGKPIAASPVRSVRARKIRELGSLIVGPGDGTRTAFSWNPYDGPAACFSWYKIVYSKDDPTPSVLQGADVALAVGNRGASEALARLEPGTYHFRLEVLRYTELGSPAKFVVAHSDVVTYTVP